MGILLYNSTYALKIKEMLYFSNYLQDGNKPGEITTGSLPITCARFLTSSLLQVLGNNTSGYIPIANRKPLKVTSDKTKES